MLLGSSHCIVTSICTYVGMYIGILQAVVMAVALSVSFVTRLMCRVWWVLGVPPSTQHTQHIHNQDYCGCHFGCQWLVMLSQTHSAMFPIIVFQIKMEAMMHPATQD